MKTKNFLFTAVLTFGAILFATNVSAQEVTFGTTEIAAGSGTKGNVELVLRLSDIQELTVNNLNSKVVFTYVTREDYNSTASKSETAVKQLKVFSTKKYNIAVNATEFTTVDKKPLTGGLGSFTVKAIKVNDSSVEGNVVDLSSGANLFTSSQSRTKVAAGDDIDIVYSLTNPSSLIDKIDNITSADFGTEEEFSSTITYTINPA